jgi:hypothetical protein
VRSATRPENFLSDRDDGDDSNGSHGDGGGDVGAYDVGGSHSGTYDAGAYGVGVSHASQDSSYGAPHSQRYHSVCGHVDDGSHSSASSSYNYPPRRDQHLYSVWAPPPSPIPVSVMYGYGQPPPQPTYVYSHPAPNPTYGQPFYGVTNLDPYASTTFRMCYFSFLIKYLFVVHNYLTNFILLLYVNMNMYMESVHTQMLRIYLNIMTTTEYVDVLSFDYILCVVVYFYSTICVMENFYVYLYDTSATLY